MTRTTIMLPGALKKRAELKSRALGISMGEFIRLSLASSLKGNPDNKVTDPFVSDRHTFSAHTGRDISSRHDDYLYGPKT